MYKLHHFLCFHQTNNQISGRVAHAQNIHQKENFAKSIIFYSNGAKKHKSQRAESWERTVDIRILVQLVNLGDDFLLGDLLGEVDINRPDANLRAGLSLHTDITLRILPRPDDHHCQTRHLTPLEMRDGNPLTGQAKSI